MRQRTTSLLLIAVVALGAMTGVAAADGHLEVGVEDADGEPTVTVTENDTAVKNATVIVSVVDEANESYAGAGEYETDANGTVALPAAEEDVTVEVSATADNESVSTTVELEAPDGLELDVDDTDGEPVVTVTDNDTAVENASVNVSTAADQNVTYAGDGDYTTGENGTVALPAAEEDVTVEVSATADNESVSTTVELEAPDGLELDVDDTDGEPVVTVTNDDEAVENATVTVSTAADQNASYVGDGDYATDENGTVGLPAPEENVTVDVTAEFEGESVTQTVDLTVGGESSSADEPFGQLVQEFIERLNGREGGIGGAVSDFVTENNPGNAPDHAGGPGGPADAEDGGNETDDENASDAPGNAPEGVGNGNNGGGGPPDHAGPGGDDDADDTEEDDAEEDEAESEEDEGDEEDEAESEEEEGDDDDEDEEGGGGPPDHAGGPGGN